MLLSWNEGDLAGGVGGPGGVYVQILAAWKVSQDKEDKQSSPSAHSFLGLLAQGHPVALLQK